MSTMSTRFAFGSALLAAALVSGPAFGQAKKGKPAPAPAAPAPQKIDEEYTKLIKKYLQDPRITTELVDHMPASDTVPSPLKFLGRIPGKHPAGARKAKQEKTKVVAINGKETAA
jgi:hypothetical protein